MLDDFIKRAQQGSFVSQLLICFHYADPNNRCRLTQAFPKWSYLYDIFYEGRWDIEDWQYHEIAAALEERWKRQL